MTRQIGRNKARNMARTEKNGSPTFVAEDGRRIQKFFGRAVYFPDYIDSPRTKIEEWKRKSRKQINELMEKEIAKYKARKASQKERRAKRTKWANQQRSRRKKDNKRHATLKARKAQRRKNRGK